MDVLDNLFAFIEDEKQRGPAGGDNDEALEAKHDYVNKNITLSENVKEELKQENLLVNNGRKPNEPWLGETCNICGYKPKPSYKSSMQVIIKAHIEQVHENIKKFYCSECRISSYASACLKRHILNKHMGIAVVLKIGCSLCDGRKKHEKCDKDGNWSIQDELKSKKSGQYKCEECDYKTNCSEGLRKHHEKNHLGLVKYGCSSCDYKKYHSLTVRRHIENKHLEGEEAKVVRLGDTEKIYEYPQNTYRRTKKSISNGKFKCNECDYSSNRHYMLKSHIDTVHLGIRNFSCKYCPYKSCEGANMKRHMQSAHGDISRFITRLDCKKCVNNEDHVDHVLCKTKNEYEPTIDGQFKCTECEYSTNSKYALKRHFNIVHYKSSNELPVNEQMNSIENESSEVEMKEIKTQPGIQEGAKGVAIPKKLRLMEVCNLCGYKPKPSASMKAHVEQVHEKVKRFYCSECRMSSYKRASLNRHVLKKHSRVAVVLKIGCGLCDSRDQHVKCDKDGNWDIQDELKSEKSGQYKCEECDYRANSRKYLRKHHEKNHLGLVKYGCSFCDYKRYHKNTVRHHIENKHLESEEAKVVRLWDTSFKKKSLIGQLKCIECEYSTNTKFALKRHFDELHFKHLNSIHDEESRIKRRSETENANKSKRNNRTRNNRLMADVMFCKFDNCEYFSGRKEYLKMHLENTHKNLLRYECGICEYKSYHAQQIRHHFIRVHKEKTLIIRRIGCKPCGDRIQHKEHIIPDNYSEHNNEVKEISAKGKYIQNTNREKITCKVKECDHEPFAKQKLRVEHYKIVHPGVKIFKCKDCSYSDNYLSNLNSHINSKHKKEVLQCSKCPYSTLWNQSYHAHMRTKHGVFQKNSKHNAGGTNFLCEGCGLSTYSKALYEAHKAAESCATAPRSVTRDGKVCPAPKGDGSRLLNKRKNGLSIKTRSEIQMQQM